MPVLEYVWNQDENEQVIRLQPKAATHTLLAVLVKAHQLWLGSIPTFVGAGLAILRCNVHVTIPTRWGTVPIRRVFPGSSTALLTGMDSPNIPLWAVEKTWLAAGVGFVPVFGGEVTFYDRLPALVVGDSIRIQTDLSNVTAGSFTAVGRLEYDFVEVTPEQWQRILQETTQR